MDVLLVAGDGEITTRLTGQLQEQGHHVDRAGSPTDGLSQAAKRRPGCVILAGDDSAAAERFGRSLETRIGARIPVMSVGDPEKVLPIIAKLEAALAVGGDEARAPARRKPRTVLVVHDHDSRRRRIASILEREGWRVEQADSDKGAGLALIDRTLDCVIFAAMLDGILADQVVRSAAVIRDAHPQPFGILVLVDAETPEAATRLLQAGADDIISVTGGPALSRRMQLVAEYRRLERENRELQAKLATPPSGD